MAFGRGPSLAGPWPQPLCVPCGVCSSLRQETSSPGTSRVGGRSAAMLLAGRLAPGLQLPHRPCGPPGRPAGLPQRCRPLSTSQTACLNATALDALPGCGAGAPGKPWRLRVRHSVHAHGPGRGPAAGATARAWRSLDEPRCDCFTGFILGPGGAPRSRLLPSQPPCPAHFAPASQQPFHPHNTASQPPSRLCSRYACTPSQELWLQQPCTPCCCSGTLPMAPGGHYRAAGPGAVCATPG